MTSPLKKEGSEAAKCDFLDLLNLILTWRHSLKSPTESSRMGGEFDEALTRYLKLQSLVNVN